MVRSNKMINTTQAPTTPAMMGMVLVAVVDLVVEQTGTAEAWTSGLVLQQLVPKEIRTSDGRSTRASPGIQVWNAVLLNTNLPKGVSASRHEQEKKSTTKSCIPASARRTFRPGLDKKDKKCAWREQSHCLRLSCRARAKFTQPYLIPSLLSASAPLDVSSPQ